MKQTKTPWKLDMHAGKLLINSIHSPYIIGMNINKENAAHIVKCVNAYEGLKAKADMFDELVEAVIDFEPYMPEYCKDKRAFKGGRLYAGKCVTGVKLLKVLEQAKELTE